MHRIKHGFDRRYSTNIFGNPNSPLEKRKYKPGQHGKSIKRKVSDYCVKLTEKQKIKVMYNISEKQLKSVVRLSRKNRKLDPGVSIISTLERRFDQVVYRLGLAPSIFAARQLVTHGHFLLNGKPANIPSILLSEGDVVAVRQKSKSMEILNRARDSKVGNLPSYLEPVSTDGTIGGTLIKFPESLEEVPSAFELKPSYIVEEYSRSV